MNFRFFAGRSFLVAFAAVCLVQAGSALAQRSVPVDRVVAVVGSEVITAVQLRDSIQRIVGQMSQQGIELPPRDVLEQQVLERMILERAQMQFARDNGIRIDDAVLGRAIARIGESNGMDEEGLREALRADGIGWEEFRDSVRNELLIVRVRESEVESEIVVTEAEIDNFLENNPEAFSGREALVAHILLRVPENVTEREFANLVQKAEEIVARHDAGEPFERLAAAFSESQDATEGGILGWRSPDRLPGLFAEAVENLRVGQVSEVLRSAAGLHLVKLLDVRGMDVDLSEQVEQTRARHILIRTSEVLDDTEVEARLNVLRERIVYGESFEELAKVHSDDLSSARGGDLGWVHRGDTVPEFERAMDALQPGEVSEPVQSPFGWHLIQVVERRLEDVSGDRLRALARNALRERKAEEAYDSWLRELRDSTYVENRLDRE